MSTTGSVSTGAARQQLGEAGQRLYETDKSQLPAMRRQVGPGSCLRLARAAGTGEQQLGKLEPHLRQERFQGIGLNGAPGVLFRLARRGRRG